MTIKAYPTLCLVDKKTVNNSKHTIAVTVKHFVYKYIKIQKFIVFLLFQSFSFSRHQFLRIKQENIEFAEFFTILLFFKGLVFHSSFLFGNFSFVEFALLASLIVTVLCFWGLIQTQVWFRYKWFHCKSTTWFMQMENPCTTFKNLQLVWLRFLLFHHLLT